MLPIASPKLRFPLDGKTAYTVKISSVFDHSMRTPYTKNGKVVAYNGELGSITKNADDPVCISQSVDGKIPFIIGNPNQYVGAKSCGGFGYLSYDGHPGYDYPTNTGTPIYSSMSGKISAIKCLVGVPCENLGQIYITNTVTGYSTWYLHLSRQVGVNTDPRSKHPNGLVLGDTVEKGELIGYSGDTGSSGSYHLHFEVRRDNGTRLGIPMDPYGWAPLSPDHGYPKGSKDPYSSFFPLIKNTRLWE